VARNLKDKETKEMIKTKSVYDRIEESDGDRILVTRFWPRGRSKKDLQLTEWLRELGPSVKLLKDWKKGDICWEVYEARYSEEMLAQQEKIRELAKRARHKTITLLCFEKEDDPCCHRHLLKKLIDGAYKATSDSLCN
jgi:uncharacterized protein YeaO (DUF488 family)